MFKRRGRRPAAASTETVLIIVAVAVVLLVGVTVFGQKIAALWKGATKTMDRGTPFAVEAGTTNLDVNTDTTIANPGGTTNEVVAANRATLGDRFPISGFDESSRRRVEAAIAALPAALREAAIREVIPSDADNAFFRPATVDEEGAPAGNGVEIGDFILKADSDQGINDAIFKLRGVNPNISFEEILFHEFAHAFEFNGGEAIVKGFVGIAFEKKRAALEADPEFQAAVAEKEAIQEILRQKAAELGLEVAEDDVDPDAFDAVFAQNPDLRDRFFAVNREITRRVEKNGFPSVFPGDKHAADRSSEFFAIVLQIAKFRPKEFQRFRELANDADPSNDILTPEEIAFIDSHPELLR